MATRVARHEFGTFAGVFTPSILTILGVIMFLRATFVVGQGGIIAAVLILLLAKGITTLTALSIGAVSTNTPVRGGGAYFLISRVLGPEFGGAIGIGLYFAQALSVPFYLLGFTEALVRAGNAVWGAGTLDAWFLPIALAAGAALFLISYTGAGWAIRTQYFIMAFLGLAIVAFLGGAALSFSGETFRANLQPNPEAQAFPFWILFALYFPAVTGILAGVNMSGDLKDPARSIPRGTLLAIAVGGAVYLVQILVCGGAFARDALVNQPYEVLQSHALLGLGFLVALGVFAATLSSALGSYLGAPRILQAVARDRIIRSLVFFGRGSAAGDEPRRALALTGGITIAVLVWAGTGAGMQALDVVAKIITMFFLYTYGMINLAAFMEDFGENPSFRPRFRFFHWLTALAGAGGCAAVAVLIDPLAAGAAMLCLTLLVTGLHLGKVKLADGDARRGFYFSSLRTKLLQLSRLREDSKNWRPTIIVFTSNPATREVLVSYAVWLEAGRGIVLIGNVIVGSLQKSLSLQQRQREKLEEFCREKAIQAFPLVLGAESLERGVAAALQAGGLGPVQPNLAMWGWPGEPGNVSGFAAQLRLAAELNQSLVLLREQGLPPAGGAKRIDIWWRGKKNGFLMLLLSHLMTRNWEWGRARIRLLHLLESETGREKAEEGYRQMLAKTRVEAEPRVIVSDRPFPEILHRESADATCVLLGFEVPAAGQEGEWFDWYERLLADLPTTILVNSQGREDAEA